MNILNNILTSAVRLNSFRIPLSLNMYQVGNCQLKGSWSNKIVNMILHKKHSLSQFNENNRLKEIMAN